MASSFPTGLDSFTAISQSPPGSTTLGTAVGGRTHSQFHTDEGDAIEALQTKVGIDGSAVTTSLDYLIKSTTGGHNHDGANSRGIAYSSLTGRTHGPTDHSATVARTDVDNAFSATQTITGNLVVSGATPIRRDLLLMGA